MRKREQVLSILAFAGSVIGGAGLILLSIFDTRRFTSVHRAFLLVFILGVSFSAIFTVIEVCHSWLYHRLKNLWTWQYRWLSKDFVRVSHLKISYITKAIIASILILLSIAFAVTLYESRNVGGTRRIYTSIFESD